MAQWLGVPTGSLFGAVALFGVSVAVGHTSPGGRTPTSSQTQTSTPSTAPAYVDSDRRRLRQRRPGSSAILAVHSAVSAAERIALASQQLSLTVVHLAEVLHVSRPTLYAWRKDSIGVRRPRALERLKGLADIAARWATYDVGALGNLLVTPVGSGQSLLDHLKAAIWSGPAIEQTLQELRAAAERRVASSAQRSDRSVAAALRRLGIERPDAATDGALQRMDEQSRAHARARI